MREGPFVSYSCLGCVFHEQERFQAQGDRGYDHYCTHSGERKHIAAYTHKTPDWCPFLVTIRKP